MIEVGIFIAGLICGMAVLRYGFGLGIKSVYQIKEDLPLNEKQAGINQENTSEYEEEI